MDKNDTNKMKYPAQMCSFKRKNKVLAIDCHLDRPAEDDPPLQMHAGWSRYGMSIIDKSKESTVVATANIPYSEAIVVAHKMLAVCDDFLIGRDKTASKANEQSDGAENESAAAYAVTFKAGSLKGKTPGEVIQSENGLKTIESQIAFLQANLAKFPDNQKVIDACNAAISAFKAGTLEAGQDNPRNGTLKWVHRTPIKFLEKRKNKDGKCFIYAYTITCDYEKTDYPWQIGIVNGYADITRKEDGSVNISSKVSDRLETSVNLSNDEGIYLAKRMEMTINEFEMVNFRPLYNEVNEMMEEIYSQKSA